MRFQYFHTHSISGEEIYLMDWDEEAGLLTYAAVPLRHLLEGKEIDWQALRNKVGLTTASVFSAKRFRRVKIDGSVLVDRRRQEG